MLWPAVHMPQGTPDQYPTAAFHLGFGGAVVSEWGASIRAFRVAVGTQNGAKARQTGRPGVACQIAPTLYRRGGPGHASSPPCVKGGSAVCAGPRHQTGQPLRALMLRVGGGGGGYFGGGILFGGGSVFCRSIPNFPPRNFLRNPGHVLLPGSAANSFLLQRGTSARVLHVKISAGVCPKNLPMNDFVSPLCIPKDCFVYPLCIHGTVVPAIVHKAPRFGGGGRRRNAVIYSAFQFVQCSGSTLGCLRVWQTPLHFLALPRPPRLTIVFLELPQPKPAPQPQAKTSSKASSSGEHVQLFRMVYDRKKCFQAEHL